MVRRNLAARSLRHLRFAHRILVSQPLLARASHVYHPPTTISFDGYQLPVGRILRRIPLSETNWLADSGDSEMGAAPIIEAATPAETLLRLLPRLPETHDADTMSAPPGDEMEALSATTSLSVQTQAHRGADDTQSAPAILPTAPPARAGGLRPRSRIVELPGTFSLPVEEHASDEPGAADMPEESPEDVSVNARAASMEDAHSTAEGEPDQPPLMRIEGEEPTTVGPGSAPQAAAEEAPPVAPSTAPRRRSKQTTVTPPRASDALFPPTDADRSPATWLARLQHADKPASSARPSPPDILGNEPSESAPLQRPGARGGRKGATRAQAATPPTPPMTSAPHERTSGAPTTSLEQSAPEEEPAQLPGSSRTLLHTLTGVDPASVHVYRGPVAERATSAQHADALTDGDAIALGGGHATDTPETLGLLAHELTHVAQRRSPRFVPPVAQTTHHQHRNNAETSAPMPENAQLAAAPADEEAQALEVEARVTRAVRAKVTPPQLTQPTLSVEKTTAPPPAHETPSRPDTQPVWGNLPAPWEPLPDWMTAHVDSPASAPHPAPQSQSQPQQSSSSSASARAPSADTPGTQRAERGRSLAADVEESSQSHMQETAAPEPDLDLLAQQVHAILKRRLAAERRRIG